MFGVVVCVSVFGVVVCCAVSGSQWQRELAAGPKEGQINFIDVSILTAT